MKARSFLNTKGISCRRRANSSGSSIMYVCYDSHLHLAYALRYRIILMFFYSTIEDYVQHLILIGFPSYLPHKSIFSLSRVSQACHKLVHKYICDNFTFLLWNTAQHSEITIYTDMRNIHIQEMIYKWPPQVTHIIFGTYSFIT